MDRALKMELAHFCASRGYDQGSGKMLPAEFGLWIAEMREKD